jgi:hypothetical protein
VTLGTSYIPPVKPILFVHDYEGLRISPIFGNTPPAYFQILHNQKRNKRIYKKLLIIEFMSEYYHSQRKRNLFDPDSEEPFKISRSKLDLYMRCPRCFYLDRRLGIGRPPGYPFSLNSAVDALLKKEFDLHMANNTPHPLMKNYKIDAVPYKLPVAASKCIKTAGIKMYGFFEG